MALNQKREDARRLDVVLCFKSQSAEPNQGAFCGLCGAGKPKTKPSTKIMQWLAQLLARWPVKIAVIIAWLGLLAMGIAGTAQMRVEADVNNFIPDGSYLKCVSRHSTSSMSRSLHVQGQRPTLCSCFVSTQH